MGTQTVIAALPSAGVNVHIPPLPPPPLVVPPAVPALLSKTTLPPQAEARESAHSAAGITRRCKVSMGASIQRRERPRGGLGRRAPYAISPRTRSGRYREGATRVRSPHR